MFPCLPLFAVIICRCAPLFSFLICRCLSLFSVISCRCPPLCAVIICSVRRYFVSLSAAICGNCLPPLAAILCYFMALPLISVIICCCSPLFAVIIRRRAPLFFLLSYFHLLEYSSYFLLLRPFLLASSRLPFALSSASSADFLPLFRFSSE